MDQRMFLAIALSMLVMIGFYAIFPPPQPPPKPAAEEGGAPAQPPVSAPESGRAAPPPAAEAPSSEPERLIEVDTPNYSALISTRGGELASFRLKRYSIAVRHYDWGDLAPFLLHVPYLGEWLAKPDVDSAARVEMVRRGLPGAGVLRVEFRDEAALTEEIAALPFRPDRDALRLSANSAPETLVLTGRTASGLTVRKTLTFDATTYVLRYGASVINYGQTPVVAGVQHWFGEGPPHTSDARQSMGHFGPMFRAEKKVRTEDPDDVAPKMLLPAVDWISISEPYFISAAKNDSPIAHALYESAERPARGGESE